MIRLILFALLALPALAQYKDCSSLSPGATDRYCTATCNTWQDRRRVFTGQTADCPWVGGVEGVVIKERDSNGNLNGLSTSYGGWGCDSRHVRGAWYNWPSYEKIKSG